MTYVDANRFKQNTIEPKFVLALYKSRIRDTWLMRLFDPLFGPEDYEIIEIPSKTVGSPLYLHTFDTWAQAQAEELHTLWPKAKVCIAMTTAICSAETTGRSSVVEIAGASIGSHYQNCLLSPKSMAETMAGKRVPFPNVLREVTGDLQAFVKVALAGARQRHHTT